MPSPGRVLGVTVRVAWFNREAFAHDVISPRHVAVHGFADDVARLREAELQRRRRADRTLRIVRCQRDAMRIGQRGDPSGFREAAAVRDVELADLAAACGEQIAKRRRDASSVRRSRSASSLPH